MKRSILIWLLVQVFLTGSLCAQSDRGTITGTVTDTSGAVVPGVQVTATNVDTGVQTAATTNDVGLYVILNLPIGRYSVSFSKQGFKTYERSGITLLIGQVAQIDPVLTVGAVTESVTVTADTDILPTANTELGTHMPRLVVQDLPLSIDGGRGLESFAYAITPAVEGNFWTSYVAGSAAFSKEVLVDGTSAITQYGGFATGAPSMEAVEEFKVETSGFRAEDARTGGGVFKFTIKSGSNKLHGSAFGLMRNEMFDANTWNNNLYMADSIARDPANRAAYEEQYRKPFDRKFDYGFSAGGPVIKDRTFVFGALERYRHEEWALGGFGGTVPIPAFLDGDFSALLGNVITWDDDGDPNTPEVPIPVQTTAGDTVNLQQGMIFDPQSPGQVFPGNVIPGNRISAPARVITDIYRNQYKPMRSGLIYNTANVANGTPKTSTSNLTLKVDHSFSERLRLTSSYVDTWGPNLMSNSQYGGIWDPTDPNKLGGPLSWTEDHGVRTNQFRFSPTYSFAPNILNTVTLTYLRYRNHGTGATAGGGWPEKMGFGEVGIGTIPEISFGGPVNGVELTAIGSGSSWQGITNIYMLNEALSWVKGRHTAKFGGEIRFMQLNTQAGFPSLRFNFSNLQTGAPGQPYSDQVGFGFASFLLGDVASANKRVPFSLYGRRKSYAIWAQDDFKVNRKLTLTMDLRWEATGPLTEKFGHWANFEYTKMNTALGIPGALEFAGDGKTSFMKNRDWKEFSPHVGVAYQLTPRSVLRASYGIFYSPLGLNFNNGVPYGFAPGYQGTNEWALRSDGYPVFNWSDGYPENFIPGTLDPNIIQSTMVRIDPDSLKAGYIQQWNAGVEFELGRDTRLGIQYVGNKGSRLHGDQFEYNQADRRAYEQLVAAGTAWNWVWDEPSAAAAGVPFPYPGFVGLAGQALAPFPQIAGNGSVLYVVGVPKGMSDYQSMQVSLTRRTSRGLSAEASYTLGRARSNADNAFETNSPWYFVFQDLSQLDKEAKVPAGIDQKHVFKGYVSWDLPFGKGRGLLGNSGRLVNGLVGGWSLSTVFLYASGQTLGIVSSSYWAGGMWNTWSSLPGWVGQPYANVSQNGDFSRQFDSDQFDAMNATAASNRYFDTSNITDPAPGEFGSGPRALPALRNFGAARENIGILKNFPINEKMRLQFRMEFLNIFNRHEFWGPDMYPSNSTFGNVTTVGGSPRIGQFGARFEW